MRISRVREQKITTHEKYFGAEKVAGFLLWTNIRESGH